MSYSKAQLLTIAKNDINKLVIIIDSYKTDIKLLETALEILGDEASEDFDIIPILNRSLNHIHLLVREAAMNAALTFYDEKILPQEIADRLRVISNNDPSSDLREFASDILDKFDK